MGRAAVVCSGRGGNGRFAAAIRVGFITWRRTALVSLGFKQKFDMLAGTRTSRSLCPENPVYLPEQQLPCFPSTGISLAEEHAPIVDIADRRRSTTAMVACASVLYAKLEGKKSPYRDSTGPY